MSGIFIRFSLSHLDFNHFLSSEQGISENKISYYNHWISLYHKFCKNNKSADHGNNLSIFLRQLEIEYENEQMVQAKEAVRLYNYFISHHSKQESSSNHLTETSAWKEIEEKIRKVLRLKHLSLQTEKIYVSRLKSFYSFLKDMPPDKAWYNVGFAHCN